MTYYGGLLWGVRITSVWPCKAIKLNTSGTVVQVQ